MISETLDRGSHLTLDDALALLTEYWAKSSK